ncbi:MAG: hypothetical protein JWR33_28 [Naasia sp.]|jgi:hypothetical protein|uniref:hypothetical protein n=1 Tax=Naasia sp. TaxID=2546198 RepID=UPI00261C88B0|nr:hypothetical protein [Naasia sp.]MCU1569287.1 hypothetical protein [Naasia sp.]
MSAALATAPLRRPISPGLPRPEPVRAPRIEIAPVRAQRLARPRVAYAGTVVAGIGALMIAQLALSIALSDGAYTIDRLETTQKEQARSVQQLTEDLGRLASPQNLAKNAEALGMVQNANPVWLRMSDGAVIGTPAAAAGGSGVLAAGGSQVANDLLNGVPLVTEVSADATGAATAAAATPVQPAAPLADPELPLQGLPAPATR